MNEQSTVICLMGPTASGKTRLAIQLSQQLPCDIISVDSAMVYRGMDIGTAKPDAEMLKIAPHQLIDICDPIESYSAAKFREDALEAIESSLARGRIPLLVGGTMLYFRALQEGLSPLPNADSEVRARLSAEADKLGWQALHERLQRVDPIAASRIHANDLQRLQRALEVYELTGKPLSQLWEQSEEALPYKVLSIAVIPPDRAFLHEKIVERFDAMLRQGFVDEVAALYRREDLHQDLPAMRSVGYRQVLEYLSGQCHYEAMRERGIIATRQLAKQQITWLRSWPDLYRLDSQSPTTFQQVLNIFTSGRK